MLFVNVSSSSRRNRAKLTSDIPDAVSARQVLLDLGIQLADDSAAGQDTDVHVGDMNEVEIKTEEEGNE